MENPKIETPVVIFDDVATTGESLWKATRAAESAGVKVVGVIVLVNRNPALREKFESSGYRFASVFTDEEILCYNP